MINQLAKPGEYSIDYDYEILRQNFRKKKYKNKQKSLIGPKINKTDKHDNSLQTEESTKSNQVTHLDRFEKTKNSSDKGDKLFEPIKLNESSENEYGLTGAEDVVEPNESFKPSITVESFDYERDLLSTSTASSLFMPNSSFNSSPITSYSKKPLVRIRERSLLDVHLKDDDSNKTTRGLLENVFDSTTPSISSILSSSSFLADFEDLEKAFESLSDQMSKDQSINNSSPPKNSTILSTITAGSMLTVSTTAYSRMDGNSFRSLSTTASPRSIGSTGFARSNQREPVMLQPNAKPVQLSSLSSLADQNNPIDSTKITTTAKPLPSIKKYTTTTTSATVVVSSHPKMPNSKYFD